MRTLLLTLLLLGATTAIQAADTTLTGQLLQSVFRDTEGEIQKLDFADWEIVVDGLRYEVARDVIVFDDGLESAFTFLRTGSSARVTYEESAMEGGRRLVRIIETVPADQITRY